MESDQPSSCAENHIQTPTVHNFLRFASDRQQKIIWRNAVISNLSRFTSVGDEKYYRSIID